ncbi:hypothetical protein ONS95_007504 [Cadophora gregata]|uniref:uncharacterized protein n=1 Tax=Cadophora gregata TaxID=51156 RepID=UPI0026DAC2A8|nr:uncharacterized protein ONS95_007504 [Cadophora gregata]KAK0125877.1 hypothetical protein ONS95_007504 [Cadophora gregata]
MHSHRPRRSSGWSAWTWDSGQRCLTRSRESGKGGQKWEFKNEKGQVSSKYVKPSDTVTSNEENQPIQGNEEDGSVRVDDADDGGDGLSSGTLTQEMSSLNVQSDPSSSLLSWNSGDSKRQDSVTAFAYSPQSPARQSAVDSYTGPSYNANPRSPQGQYEPPRWKGSMSSRIKTRNPNTRSEVDDKHFKVHESRKFKFGKVFRIMWSEPFGSNGTAITSRGASRNATLKSGVHADDHAVIYTDRDAGPEPCLLPGEILKKKALRMEPENSSFKLDTTSRVNYAKVYTVEHNVKVQFIGTLCRNAQAQLSADYNDQHPLIQEIEPEPGYVVHRHPRSNYTPGPIQYYEDMRGAQDELSDAQAITPSSVNLPRYVAAAGVEMPTTYENTRDANMEMYQDSTYTIQPQDSAVYDLSQVQFTASLSTNPRSVDELHRTPRVATPDQHYPNQQSNYDENQPHFDFDLQRGTQMPH